MVRRAVMASLLIAALLGQGCGSLPQSIGRGAVAPGEAPATPASPSPLQPSPQAASPASAAPAAADHPKAPVSAGTAVKPKVDQEKAQTALIPASSGGKIELKSGNGVTYTLEVPKDALLSDEIITMAPVAQIDGLPLSGGLLGAVDLRPEGMRLVKPATLTIQLPAGFKAADLIGFAYQGGGEDFHLYPVSAKGTAITANLMHFSSYGGGQGTQADSQTQQGKTPTGAESQFENEMGAALDNARRTGSDPSSNQQVEEALRHFFDNQLSQDLKTAETNDGSIDTAVAEYLTWLRNVQLLGMEAHFETEMKLADASVKKGLRNAFDKASQRCAQDLDWEQGLKMLNRARQAELLYGIQYEDLDSKLQQCWTFRLDYESIITWELDDNMNIVAHVKSQVPLNMNSDMTAFDGEAPLKYVEYKVEWRGESSMMNSLCDIETTTTDTTLSVSPMILRMNLSTDGPAQTKGFLAPEETTEQWSWVCDMGAGKIRTKMPFPSVGWSTGFHEVHKRFEVYETVINGVRQDAKRKYLFANFKSVGKPVIARKTGTDTATVNGSKVTDEYTIDIVHMPKGGTNDMSNSSSETARNEPARKPVGPKTIDASALPPELQSIPGPPDFGVVDQSISRSAPGGSFEFARASWWGAGSISETAGFYRQVLSADWIPGDETVSQSSFSMEFVSKTDSKRTLILDGKTDSGGIRVLETVQQK